MTMQPACTTHATRNATRMRNAMHIACNPHARRNAKAMHSRASARATLAVETETEREEQLFSRKRPKNSQSVERQARAAEMTDCLRIMK